MGIEAPARDQSPRDIAEIVALLLGPSVGCMKSSSPIAMAVIERKDAPAVGERLDCSSALHPVATFSPAAARRAIRNIVVVVHEELGVRYKAKSVHATDATAEQLPVE